jgi:quercetin dioxygenase-like cupin family protein
MLAGPSTETLWFIDNLARVRLDGEASGGALAIVELHGARGDMPPLHVHHEEDEVFHVLEGRLSLHLPGASIEVGPGETAFAPRGVPHVYRVESERAAWLGIAAPAGFDAFVREVSRPAEAEELPPPQAHDVARIAEIGARYGIELLGPPGTMP